VIQLWEKDRSNVNTVLQWEPVWTAFILLLNTTLQIADSFQQRIWFLFYLGVVTFTPLSNLFSVHNSSQICVVIGTSFLLVSTIQWRKKRLRRQRKSTNHKLGSSKEIQIPVPSYAEKKFHFVTQRLSSLSLSTKDST